MATECFQKVHVSSNQTVTNGISPVWRNCKTRRSWKFICSTLFFMIELEHGLIMGLMFESLPSRNQTYIQPKSQISPSLSKRNIYKWQRRYIYIIWLYDESKRISQKNPLFSVGGFPVESPCVVPRSKGEEALKILAEGAEQQVAGSPGIPSGPSSDFSWHKTRFPKPGCLVHWKFSSIPQVVSCIIDYWLICMSLLHKSLLQAEKHSPEGKQ